MSKKIITLLLMISLSLCCNACGENAASSPETNVEESDSQEAGAFDSSTGSGTSQEENAVEETLEENNPVTDEVDMESFLVEAAQQGPVLAVWNETTHTQHLIENSESYQAAEGDRFFMCISMDNVESVDFLTSLDISPYQSENPQSSDFLIAEVFTGNNSYVNLQIELSKRGESSTRTFNFKVLTEDFKKDYVSTDGYEYCFVDEYNNIYNNNLKFFGFNFPDAYSADYSLCSDYSVVLNNDSLSLTIVTDFDDQYKNIYNGLETETTHNIWATNEDTMTDTYEDIGEYNTPYGTAKLYLISTEYSDFDTIHYRECAILCANGYYIGMNLWDEDQDTQLPTVHIADILPQLF